ncbi:hypothetical protein ES319_A09G116000v1 [Gossypium barbadense]|uniref:Non-haem dioxygenase N-terminal domain-containing protein n=2 Tax=Gossypium TaxID=3633 RepID=A0A5J5UGC2_GOSBA|nr:hypothetical protein ES319_A09G116000v1 [Gossypium barbadense]KAB2065812.1 hypothetical protein ES319_A09G116000v1 [Gossypium barbadense]TYH02383.1 hypothetical protein ES288_A09G136700v1 [Gossypium darwinii]TYH02386.1 hypothetical protein ES288_A09G136700v1 [Gossypium darwinii]
MPPRNPKSEKILDFVVNKGNGIKGLVDTGIETVPDLYILPIEERLLPNNILTYDSIPVIDVSNWDDPKVKESIRDAAGKWGFFQIINHGVPLHVLDAVKEAAHRFFGLPYEERNKYWAGNSLTDTVTLKTSFVPQAEAALEWKDYLSFRCSPRDLESFPLWPPVCRFRRSYLFAVLDQLKNGCLRGLDIFLSSRKTGMKWWITWRVQSL